ncbi:MAG: YkgJ family cysteine cluster protein [Oligoflexia bacterium]|nr:YkgJ family cysteine cluster protein [Oligoflexia bacterium]
MEPAPKGPNAADAQRPSTWRRYKSGMCDGCWAGCCTLPVEASASDLIRLELITEEEAAESLKRVAKRLKSEGYIQAFVPRTQLFVLEQRNGRDCIFLGKDRLCTVYQKRPEVCRKFPTIGPRPGFCPVAKKG